MTDLTGPALLAELERLSGEAPPKHLLFCGHKWHDIAELEFVVTVVGAYRSGALAAAYRAQALEEAAKLADAEADKLKAAYKAFYNAGETRDAALNSYALISVLAIASAIRALGEG